MVASPSTVTRVSSSGWLARLPGGVLRHWRLVVVCWLVPLVVGGFGAGRVSNRLTFDFALPGQSGYETAHRIEQLYGNGGEQAPSILVVSVPQGQTVDRDQARIANAIERLRRQQPRLRVVDYSATKDTRFVTRDGRSTWAFVFAPKARVWGAKIRFARRESRDLQAGRQF
jgi:putative drug exporter of the RND superfamily